MKALLIHPEELTKKWVDRMKRLGCTALAFHPVGGDNAEKSLKELIELCQNSEFCRLVDYAQNLGLKIEYHMHAIRYLIPKEIFSEYPQWFRQNEQGERVPDYNFCISNSEALNFVAENSLKLTKKLYKTTSSFYFWMDDAKNARCHCEKCREFSDSDLNLMVMNAVIKKLRKEIPEAKICYLAYCDTLPVPKKVKPESGIFLQYAPFERDFTKGAVSMTEKEKQNIRELIGFFGNKDSAVLEYWYDNSMYSGWKKPPKKFVCNNKMIETDIDFYKKLGFSKIDSFACYLGEDYEALYGEPDISAFSY